MLVETATDSERCNSYLDEFKQHEEYHLELSAFKDVIRRFQSSTNNEEACVVNRLVHFIFFFEGREVK